MILILFMINTKIGNIGENVEWVFDFDVIKYNNESIPIPLLVRKSLVKIDFGLILAPFNLKQYLRRQFFAQACLERGYGTSKKASFKLILLIIDIPKR